MKIKIKRRLPSLFEDFGVFRRFGEIGSSTRQRREGLPHQRLVPNSVEYLCSFRITKVAEDPFERRDFSFSTSFQPVTVSLAPLYAFSVFHNKLPSQQMLVQSLNKKRL